MTEYVETIPKRRVTACALFLDEDDHILIVKPTYRKDEDWLLPGGAIEEAETPLEGCRREVREELGVEFGVYQLLCLEYQSVQMRGGSSAHFTFYGGILSKAQIGQIKLPENELSEFRFCTISEVKRLLSPRLWVRVEAALPALKERRIVYLEDKIQVGGWF